MTDLQFDAQFSKLQSLAKSNCQYHSEKSQHQNHVMAVILSFCICAPSVTHAKLLE